MSRLLCSGSPKNLGEILRTASTCCRNSSSISIVETVGSDVHLDSTSLQDWIKINTKENQDRPRCRIFFVSGSSEPSTKHVHIEPSVLLTLHHNIGLSAKFISDVYETEDWAILNISSRVEKRNSRAESLVIQYGFCLWVDSIYSHSFLYLQTSQNLINYVSINFPEYLIERLVQGFLSDRSRIQQPLIVDIWIINEILQIYRGAISARREKLIEIEKQKVDLRVDAQTRQLHRLIVQWQVLSKELLELAEQTKYLRHCLETHGRDLYQGSLSDLLDQSEQLMMELESSIQYYQKWAAAYRDRTNVQISLYYHLEAQTDNRLMRDIGQLSAQVALQTQQDSALMSILAGVATIFLPTTFVATIFSTVFFNASASSLQVYDKWWILPVAGISLTVITSLVGLFCLKWRRRRSTSKDHLIQIVR